MHHGGFDVPALGHLCSACAAVQHGGTFVACELGIRQHLVHMCAVGHRSQFGLGIKRIANADGTGALDKSAHEFGRNRALHQNARTGQTLLTIGHEDAGQRTVERALQIGTLQDDVGRLAAQLHRGAFKVACRRRIDQRSARAAAGERHQIDVRMADQGGASDCAPAIDHVHHAIGHTCFAQDLHQAHKGQRRVFRRLEHATVAERQRRRNLATGHVDRAVPG